MPHVRSFIAATALPLTLTTPACATEPADPLAAALEASLCRTATADSSSIGGSIVQAQYITREQQQQQARENLERRRQERNNPPPTVDRSTTTTTGQTYGREYQERAIQGTDKPRVTRPW